MGREAYAMTEKIKVLIGCPTCDRYRYCVDLWVERVKEIIEFSKNKGIDADYVLVDNSKEDTFFNELKKKNVEVIRYGYSENVKSRISESRNVLREKALDKCYDYFLSLEQDVIPPANIAEKLISHNRKIVSAYYGKPLCVVLQDKETGEIKKALLELPVVYLPVEGGIRQANPPEVVGKGLIKVGAFGVGCVLIHCEVLKKIKFRHEEGKEAFDDFVFCADAKQQGYDLYLDSDIRVEHLHKVWEESYANKL
jgi:GT2 family glycosyltransferase